MKGITDEIIIELYQDLSMSRIAQKLNCSVGFVYNRIKANNVKTRPQKGGMLGKHHTEEVKKKISKANTGRVMSKESREKISKAKFKGYAQHKKLRTDGYVAIYFPNHHRHTKEGYVMEHIYVMEQMLGRNLAKNEVVHHINEIRSDNRPENLMVMTASQHMSYHSTKRHREKRGGI